MVTYMCIPSIWKRLKNKSQVQGQPGLQSNILAQEKKKRKKEKKKIGRKIAYIKFKRWLLFIGYFLTSWGLNLGPSTC